jgi:imidazoleglycerol-phosphate dehydratase / histidinol-phosphatase
MTPRMLLIIDPASLTPAPAAPLRWPMRRGSLSALRKLLDRGIQPALAGGKHPNPSIASLLDQEGIVLADPESDEWKERPIDQLCVDTEPGGDLILTRGSGDTPQAPAYAAGPATSDAGTKSDTGNATVSEQKAEPAPAGSPVRETFAEWSGLADWLLNARRTATRARKTAETDITVRVNLDGTGKSHIDTGIPFYDHMLEQIARHGYMDLDITCRGDLEIDEHHTIEDTAIVLGEAISEALGDKRGIGRYGFAVAMDETRSLVAIDLSGRPWCVFDGTFHREKVGDFPTEMTSHFFHTLAMALRATLHVSVKGENDHHQIEASFKALARCLRQAVDRNEHYLDILPSSKGML